MTETGKNPRTASGNPETAPFASQNEDDAETEDFTIPSVYDLRRSLAELTEEQDEFARKIKCSSSQGRSFDSPRKRDSDERRLDAISRLVGRMPLELRTWHPFDTPGRGQRFE
jgi:hypothetical protein